jgi:hypothetical protein
LFELGGSADLFGEGGVFGECGEASGEGYAHVAVEVYGDEGFGDEEAAHDGSEEVGEEVVEGEGGGEEFGGFQEGLEAGVGEFWGLGGQA